MLLKWHENRWKQMPLHAVNFHFAEYYLVDFIVWKRTNSASANIPITQWYTFSSVQVCLILWRWTNAILFQLHYKHAETKSQSFRQIDRQTVSRKQTAAAAAHSANRWLHYHCILLRHESTMYLNVLIFTRWFIIWLRAFKTFVVLTEQREMNWVQIIICQ